MSELIATDNQPAPADDSGETESRPSVLREVLQWGILGTVAVGLVGGISYVHWQYVNSSAFNPETAYTLICH